MSRALLQQALEAIRKNLVSYSIKDEPALYDVFIKIEAELAKPDEPVAYRQYVDGSDESNLGWWDYLDADEIHDGYEPLYTSPQPKLTPSEFWNAAPWNDDMDSIYINERVFIKYADNSIDIATMYSTGTMFRDNGHKVIKKYIAWLPLPDNK